MAQRTLPSAISRRAITTSRLSELTSGLDPLRSCRARFAARATSSKRLETLSRQSSTVILAIAHTRPRRRRNTIEIFFILPSEQEGSGQRLGRAPLVVDITRNYYRAGAMPEGLASWKKALCYALCVFSSAFLAFPSSRTRVPVISMGRGDAASLPPTPDRSSTLASTSAPAIKATAVTMKSSGV